MVVSNMTQKLLSTGKAAARLGVTNQTVRRWIEAGRLKAYRYGAHYRIDAIEVDRLLK